MSGTCTSIPYLAALFTFSGTSTRPMSLRPIDALPHFRRRTEDRHGIVGADGDPGIDPGNLRGAQRVGHAAQAGSVKANISPAAPSTKPRRLTAVATDAWLVCLVMA